MTEEQKSHEPNTNQNEKGYDPRDKFTMHPDAIEWLTDEEAKAYEKWLEETPEVSSTEGVAPEYVLDDDAEEKPSKKMRGNWTPERLEKVCIALCIVARELEEIRDRELEEQQAKNEALTPNSREITPKPMPNNGEEERNKPRKPRRKKTT